MTEDEEEEIEEEGGGLDPTDNQDIDTAGDAEFAEGNVDLDEMIPEADPGLGGEYEHTDTEVEDVSSSDDDEEDAGVGVAGGIGGVGVGVGAGQQGRMRGPVVGTFRQGVQGVVQRVGGLGSSVFGSSPVRESLGGRGGRRRSAGGGGRGRGGREN